MPTLESRNPKSEGVEIDRLTPTLAQFSQQYSDHKTKSLVHWEIHNYTFDVRPGGQSLWITAQAPSGLTVALRAGYCLDRDFVDYQLQVEDRSASFWLSSSTGHYRIRLELPDARQPLIHWTIWFTPLEDIALPNWPRDVYPVGSENDPMQSKGTIHVRQRGPRSGLLFFTMLEPEKGSVLYFQNLTAINNYSEKTQTAPTDRVGGDWPGLGYAPAPAIQTPLPGNEEVILSDAFVLLSAEAPKDSTQAARLFIEMLAKIYLQIPRPEVTYRAWPDRVERTLHHLHHSPLCTREVSGHRFINPYVGATKMPPESMVQLSVLLPLDEFSEWSGREVPLVKELSANLNGFYDSKAGTVGRWLMDTAFPDNQTEDHAKAEAMDSWYLYHALGNLARAAMRGNATAHTLFLNSLDYAIKVAQYFNYKWPVFFDIYTLETLRGEVGPGQGGENDVAGLYAWVMLNAWKLTGERRYFEEAERAARSMEGLGFNLAYQMNNTAMGAKALVTLWRETGDEFYLNLSYVCIANILQHVWLWECEYGNAKHYHTFFGVLPLKDAPYLAMFEEFEVPASIFEYLAIGKDDLPDAVRLLLTELCRYSVHHVWYFYPQELPHGLAADKPKTGVFEPELEIPLEDFYEGWQKPGQVGQEVYGAGAPFALLTRYYHRPRGLPFILYCDYPLSDISIKKASGSSTVQFKTGGDKRLHCRLRLIPTGSQRLSLDCAELSTTNRETPYRGKVSFEGHLEYIVCGGETLALKWRTNLSQRRRVSSKYKRTHL